MLLIKEFDLFLCPHNPMIRKLNFIILKTLERQIYLKRLCSDKESQSNLPYYLGHIQFINIVVLQINESVMVTVIKKHSYRITVVIKISFSAFRSYYNVHMRVCL